MFVSILLFNSTYQRSTGLTFFAPIAWEQAGVATGSIVNISITRDLDKEQQQRSDFLELQEEIYQEFNRAPEVPQIYQKAATQTSVTVSWDPLKLYNCELRAIDVFKKGQRTGAHFIGHNAAKLTGLGGFHWTRVRQAHRSPEPPELTFFSTRRQLGMRSPHCRPHFGRQLDLQPHPLQNPLHGQLDRHPRRLG